MSLSRKSRRLWILALCALGIGTASALALSAFQDNIVFFRSPSDVAATHPEPGRAFRLGGLVEAGSLHRDTSADNVPHVSFRVTDGQHTVAVRYAGVLPDLFREGQGIVALGKLNAQGVVVADEVLAKHDEKYMPPEVTKALNESGQSAPAAANEVK